MKKELDIKSIHFIGVGGVGMSGIAQVAQDQGMKVSGSDLRRSTYTDKLIQAGILVHIGQDASNVPEDVDVVVASTAILDNNPELIEARRRGIPVWHRARMLAQLGRGLDTLAVTGTHGKTTSSSMLASVLDALGASPTFLVGGTVRAYGSNAHSGSGKYYVVEADESDKSFTHLSPAAIIVTNIETDHLDHYKDLNEIYDKFSEFISSVPDDGVVVACGDDVELVKLVKKTGKRMVTYGTGENNTIRVSNFHPQGVGSNFVVSFSDGEEIPVVLKNSLGIHNALNAVSVIALCSELGYSREDAAHALEDFGGVGRRFEHVGTQNDICVVDDYAHHPTEIAATIASAKQLDFNKVHVLFQPHRYSRAPLFCEVLHDEFSHAFDQADTVTFMDVYPAGETPVPGVNGKTFLNVVLESNKHPRAAYSPRRKDTAEYLASIARPGDLIITMGAGDVTAMGAPILDCILQKSENNPSSVQCY